MSTQTSSTPLIHPQPCTSVEWSRETIYTQPSAWSPMPARPGPISDYHNSRRAHPFTDAFVAELLRETEWVQIDEFKVLTEAEAEPILRGDPCPLCGTDGYWIRFRGTSTNITISQGTRCSCWRHRKIASLWLDPGIVPKRFRNVRLATLKPVGYPTSLLSMSRQAEIIADLQAQPDRSYLLSGDAGTGKTHFSIALLRHGIESWAIDAERNDLLDRKSVFRANTRELLDEHHRWITRRDAEHLKPPSISASNIKTLGQAGCRVRLYLDEIDKFGPTKFRMDTLFELVDAVYSVEGQIVAVSNASLAMLQKLWSEFDSADAIFRRICGKEANGTLIPFIK
jgi:hypothetical protein